MTKIEHFFTSQEKQDIIKAIVQAELNTSGEIRVHIERNCSGDVISRAKKVFEKLKLHKTELRNGVLFYIAVNNRKFAILGDIGINEKVPENFWEETKDILFTNFSNGEFSKGLIDGILKAGEQLKQHFSYQSDDINELPDDISFSEQ